MVIYRYVKFLLGVACQKLLKCSNFYGGIRKIKMFFGAQCSYG